MSELLTIKEAARYLRMNPLTVYRLASKGKVPAVKVGRHWRIHQERLEAWLRSDRPPSRPRVLVVDDDEAIGSLFKAALSQGDYEVFSVPTGEGALAVLRSLDCQVVFLDLMLPGMDGAETFRRIRATHPQVPVVIMTGYPDSNLMARALEIGPVGVMKKSFGPGDIQQAVAAFAHRGEPSRA
ncbi:MAG: response regulator [Chloroflexi bacterium]|nr:response regulator [Chloroflexota bacterium]